jgi:pimeloyl-ACP methyl ester carboxylesterase
VATAGEGPPVLLLHGWPQHWWMWRKVIPDLARTHRVYAPDLRGFGWSDAPEGRYSKMGLACDVERLLDELGIDEVDIVGHDWGGMVAFLTAIRMPRRVRRLAVFDMVHPWMRVTQGSALSTALSVYIPILAAPLAGARIQRHTPFVRVLLQTGTRGFRWPEEDLRLFADSFRRPAHARAASALYRTFLTSELPALVAGRYANRRLEMPILLATGEHDPIVTPDRIRGAGDRAPNLRTTVIEGAGHFVVDERPQRVIELIREAIG